MRRQFSIIENSLARAGLSCQSLFERHRMQSFYRKSCSTLESSHCRYLNLWKIVVRDDGTIWKRHSKAKKCSGKKKEIVLEPEFGIVMWYTSSYVGVNTRNLSTSKDKNEATKVLFLKETETFMDGASKEGGSNIQHYTIPFLSAQI